MISNQRRVFFDVSGLIVHLRSSGTFSGIQRVLVSILAELCGTNLGKNVFLSWLEPKSGQYKAISINEFSSYELTSPEMLARFFKLPTRRHGVFPPLRRYSAHPVKYRFHFFRLQLNAYLRRELAFKKYGSSIARWHAYTKAAATPKKYREAISFTTASEPQDRLLLIDSNWMAPRSMEHFQTAHDRGLYIQVMIHDLIPLLHPQFQPGSIPIVFHDWLLDTLSFTDGYLANSQATRRDLERFLSLHKAKQKISVVPLAQSKLNLLSEDHSAGDVLKSFSSGSYPLIAETIEIDDRIRCLAGSHFVLCVGTIEIRKNHWRLAKAWDLLRDQLPSEKVPKLVIAGKKGWMVDDFYNLIKGTAHLYGSIVILDTVSDRELAFLYRHCLFSVMPSLYEGWGLPVGESLSYGRTAVVSRAGALPEVGGDLVRYCDPHSPSDIMRACRELILDADMRSELENRINLATLRQWRDVAREILDLGAVN